METSRLLHADQLRAKNACREQVNLFTSLFGESVLVTEAWALEHAARFDWNWGARNLLSATNQDEYERVAGLASAEYDERVRGLAWAEYKRVAGPAWAEYERVAGPARAEYQRVDGLAWAEYQRVAGPAWAEYQRVTGLASAEYQRVRGLAWARLYIAEGAK